MTATSNSVCTNCCNLPLRQFTLHVRSFHAKKTFGRGGLGYNGDNRGYSLSETATSRVRHFVKFATDTPKVIAKQAHSDPSSHPSFPPWPLDQWKHTYDKKTGPTVTANIPQNSIIKTPCQRDFLLHTGHSGVNRAIWGAVQGVVPALDVFTSSFVSLDRKSRTLTIAIQVTGDAFPDAESYILDERHQAIFLGTHLRAGNPMEGSLAGAPRRPMFNASLSIELGPDGNFGGNLYPVHYSSAHSPPIKNQKISVSEWNKLFLNLDPSPLGRDLRDYILPTPSELVIEVIKEIFE